MAKFMVLYVSSTSAREQMANATPEQAQAGMDAWMQWAGKAGDAIVDLGAPLAAAGPSAVGEVSGYSIMQADAVEAVRAVLDGHPHFHSPGDPTIEVLEFLPVPGM